MKVLANSKAETIFVGNGTSNRVCVFKVNDYRRVDLFMTIKQIDGPITSLHNHSLSQVTFLRESFYVYCFDYFSTRISVTVFHEASAEDVNRSSTGVMTVGRSVLNNSAKILLVHRCHLVKSMRQLYVKCELERTQQLRR